MSYVNNQRFCCYKICFCSIKHKILQNSRFQIYPGEDEVSSCKIRRRVWCLATKSKVTDYRSYAGKVASFSEFCKCSRESLKSLPNLLLFGVEGSAGLPNLPNLRFSELGCQSNTNSESLGLPFSELAPIKHTLRSSLFQKRLASSTILIICHYHTCYPCSTVLAPSPKQP